MADSIQIVNTYTKNGNNEVGNFAIATGNITNCIPTVATSAVFLENIPPLIDEPIKIIPCVTLNFTGTNLNWTLPCLSDYGGNLCYCAADYNKSGEIQSNINGTFNVTFRIRGVIETTGLDVWSDPGTYIQPYVQKNPSGYNSNNNVYSLIVGSDTYLLNYGNWDGTLTVLDYTFTIPIQSNQNYTLDANSIDSVETKNYQNLLVSDNDPSNPIKVQQPYPGQFMQIDLIDWSYGYINKNNTCIQTNPRIYGCTDPTAINYNPTATADDGSCVHIVYGCTDPTAVNYNPLANVDDGSCSRNFDANYITVRYKFNDGLDLDTRTSLIAPEIGNVVGWCKEYSFTGSNGLLWYEWGGDNTGVGVETVTFFLDNIRNAYPKVDIKGLSKAFWFNQRVSGNLDLELTAYLGGTMEHVGYDWVNVGGTVTAVLNKYANATTNTSSCVDGDYITNWTYNLSNGGFSWT
jgi:hypothetical protein